MAINSITFILALLVWMVIFGGIVYLFLLIVRALRRYIRSADQRQERASICRTLGENLKAHRMARKMTQEFVAEALGVSRQAVSKWETGASDPSTANLLALAKLYGVPPEELLRQAAE